MCAPLTSGFAAADPTGEFGITETWGGWWGGRGVGAGRRKRGVH